jgi:PhnB protein
MSKSAAPEGFNTVTPYLLVENAAEVIDFMQRAFHAQAIHKQELPNGVVVHAQVRIGDSMVMLGQAGGEMGPMPAMLYLYDANVDAAYARALGAGA